MDPNVDLLKPDYAEPRKVPYGQSTLLNVEIISLLITNRTRDLNSQAWSACYICFGTYERNGQPLKDINNENDVKKFVVEWEPDRRGQQTWTEIHDGNVEAVLRRLRGREGLGRSDVLIMLY